MKAKKTAKRKNKTYTVFVTETYTKEYEITAGSPEEAEEIADELASDDMDLACPENMDNREIEVKSEEKE